MDLDGVEVARIVYKEGQRIFELANGMTKVEPCNVTMPMSCGAAILIWITRPELTGYPLADAKEIEKAMENEVGLLRWAVLHVKLAETFGIPVQTVRELYSLWEGATRDEPSAFAAFAGGIVAAGIHTGPVDRLVHLSKIAAHALLQAGPYVMYSKEVGQDKIKDVYAPGD